MSARNFLHAREKNINKLIDSLPNINQQKPFYRQELPALSAKSSNIINRNINYSFEVQQYAFDHAERVGTPFSDFFSDSETGTPDFRSEESDSSAGSVLRRNTAETTKILADEWERIERTIYDEEGEKATRPHIVEECKQWRHLHPQLRVVGRAIQLPEKRISYRQVEHEEVIAMHYSDYEEFSESEERLSQSSTDVTPQNSPRPSVSEDIPEPKLLREKVSFFPTYEENLPDNFYSLLQITPIQIRSPSQRKRQNSSILKSEIASSRWMRNSRPESSVNCDRNSAKSFISLDTRNYSNLVLSASDRNQALSRVVTARQRDQTRLEPLCTPDLSNETSRIPNSLSHHVNSRKVSLPPLLLEEEKRKIGTVTSAKKHTIGTAKTRKGSQKSSFQLDRVKYY